MSSHFPPFSIKKKKENPILKLPITSVYLILSNTCALEISKNES